MLLFHLAAPQCFVNEPESLVRPLNNTWLSRKPSYVFALFMSVLLLRHVKMSAVKKGLFTSSLDKTSEAPEKSEQPLPTDC